MGEAHMAVHSELVRKLDFDVVVDDVKKHISISFV